MISILIAVCGFSLVGVMSYLGIRQIKKSERTEVKLKQAEKVIDHVEKSKGAYGRLDDKQLKRLHRKYNRK
jgi:hypothetical protein